MKKKIAILGSTGSIGKNLLKILEKDKSGVEILLLTANKNHKVLLNQIKKYNVKNIIITNKLGYKILVKKLKKRNVNIYNDYSSLNLISYVEVSSLSTNTPHSKIFIFIPF